MRELGYRAHKPEDNMKTNMGEVHFQKTVDK